MATVKQKDFQQKMNKMDLAGAYFLFGDETYFVDEAVGVLKSRCLEDSIEEFNFDSFSYPSTDFTRFDDSIQTLPMMAKQRLVLLQLSKEPNKTDSAKIFSALSKVPDSCVVVVKGGGIEFKKAFLKSMESLCHSVRFFSPFPNEMARWVNKLAKNVGLTIEPDAAVLMFELVGSKLSDLKASIEKLSIYLEGEEPIVDKSLIEEFFVRSKEDNGFDLANAVADRNPILAIEQLHNLLNQGINENVLLAILFRHFKNMYITKESLSSGEDSYQIARSIGVPPKFVKTYTDQSRNWSLQRLQIAIQALHITEKALRSSKLKPQIWMENFILKIC